MMCKKNHDNTLVCCCS